MSKNRRIQSGARSENEYSDMAALPSSKDRPSDIRHPQPERGFIDQSVGRRKYISHDLQKMIETMNAGSHIAIRLMPQVIGSSGRFFMFNHYHASALCATTDFLDGADATGRDCRGIHMKNPCFEA